MSPFVFADPQPAAIAAIAVILGWVALLSLRRTTFRRSWLRLVVLLAVIVAFAQPKVETKKQVSAVTVLVDISESIDEQTGAALLARAKGIFTTETELQYLPFASTVAPDAETSARSFESLKSRWFRLNSGASNLEAALRSPLLTSDGPIVLLSDGFETVGDAKAAIPQLVERRQQLFVVAPEATVVGAGFSVAALHAPLVAARGKSVPIHIALSNPTDVPQQGKLIVVHGDKKLSETTVRLQPRSESSVTVLSDPSGEGIQPISATLRPEQSGQAESSRTIYLAGQAGERILLLHGSTDDGRFLGEALRGEAYEVDEFTGGGAGLSTIDLERYSVTVLNNFPRSALPLKLQAALPNRVRNGMGLVMIGGNQSFGLGGYLDTPIASLLPVELVPPQTTKKRLNVAVALVLDKSRSMAADERIEFAKEGARQVIQNLKDDDYVTVIGFDAAPFIVVKLGQVGQIRDEAINRIGRLFPSQRTNMLPAIDEGRRALERAPAGRKHMILLTDGRVPDAGPYYVELIKQMRMLGITVSTVMVGGEVDEGFLNTLADQGGGSFYQATDPRSLPRIFLSDVKVNAGERTMKEGGDYQVLLAPNLRSTALRSYPPVRGFVETKPRDPSVARRELDVYRDGAREVLLASWRVGSGTSIAFTSDANGRWSNQWAGWSGFRRFWSDIVASARRPDGATETANFELRTNVAHGALELDLSLFDEDVTDVVTGDLIAPDGSTQAISFRPISRGHVTATLPNVKPGRYEFRGKLPDRRLTPVAIHISGDSFGEQQGRGANQELLGSLVSKTKGALNPVPGSIELSPREEKTEQFYGGWILGLALVLLLLDILRRER